MAGLIGVILLFGAMGLGDDLFTLPERYKFLTFLGLCLAIVALAGPVTWMRISNEIGFVLPIWAGFAGSVLFAFTVTNAVNFMDGSDGMLASVMIPASVALAWVALASGASDAALLCFAVAGSLLGFWGLNRAPAKIFSGDIGSLTVGATYSVAGLLVAGTGLPGGLWVGPLFILPFLADVLLTLLRRAKHGRLSLRAHREHAYQRLIQSGWSHSKVAITYGLLTCAIGFTGTIAAQGPDMLPYFIFIAWTLILSVLYGLVSRYAGASQTED
jgi:UDP-N-acetylmuramyl pentapeptide phosphotransferase/UDP-N-acetylglucosamine-1-phosphate transferase